MPAQFNYQLFQFADTVLSASQQVLSGSGISSVHIQRAGDNEITPRVELNATLGNAFHYKPTGSNIICDAYNGQLHALVVTDRAWNDLSHSAYIGKVYDTLCDVNAFNNVLSYHRVSYMQPSSFSPQITDKMNYDLSVIVIDYKIWIKPEAWPT
jgi:hypothetical protein